MNISTINRKHHWIPLNPFSFTNRRLKIFLRLIFHNSHSTRALASFLLSFPWVIRKLTLMMRVNAKCCNTFSMAKTKLGNSISHPDGRCHLLTDRDKICKVDQIKKILKKRKSLIEVLHFFCCWFDGTCEVVFETLVARFFILTLSVWKG